MVMLGGERRPHSLGWAPSSRCFSLSWSVTWLLCSMQCAWEGRKIRGGCCFQNTSWTDVVLLSTTRRTAQRQALGSHAKMSTNVPDDLPNHSMPRRVWRP